MTLRAVTGGGTVDASNITGVLAVANGGTGGNTQVTNKLLVGHGTAAIGGIASGNQGQILQSQGAAVPAWVNVGDPKFSVQLSVAQNITSATFTKVTLNSVDYDTTGAWDATNHRWIPQVAGKYQVNCGMYATIVGPIAATNAAVIIYKNGVATFEHIIPEIVGNDSYILPCSKMVTMNGTTDYIELYVSLSGTGAIALTATNFNFLEAFYVGP